MVECPIYHCKYCGTPTRLDIALVDAPENIDCKCGKTANRAGTANCMSDNHEHKGQQHKIILGN